MKENREEYQNEKEKREKRLLAYADMIQSAVQQDSSEVIRQLVEERKRQRLWRSYHLINKSVYL